jgi:hypothetical protein
VVGQVPPADTEMDASLDSARDSGLPDFHDWMTPEHLRQHLLEAQSVYRGSAVRLVSRSRVVVPTPYEGMDEGPSVGPVPVTTLRALGRDIEDMLTIDSPTFEDADAAVGMDPAPGPVSEPMSRAESDWHEWTNERAHFLSRLTPEEQVAAARDHDRGPPGRLYTPGPHDWRRPRRGDSTCLKSRAT